jgi:hypothetical protein
MKCTWWSWRRRWNLSDLTGEVCRRSSSQTRGVCGKYRGCKFSVLTMFMGSVLVVTIIVGGNSFGIHKRSLN